MFMYSYCCVCSVLGTLFHCVVLCIVCVNCTVLLPPGFNQKKKKKYIINIRNLRKLMMKWKVVSMIKNQTMRIWRFLDILTHTHTHTHTHTQTYGDFAFPQVTSEKVSVCYQFPRNQVGKLKEVSCGSYVSLMVPRACVK
jgi:hypothetical protein